MLLVTINAWKNCESLFISYFIAMKQLQEAMKKADENTRMKQDKVRS
jgi:hypothetical protein